MNSKLLTLLVVGLLLVQAFADPASSSTASQSESSSTGIESSTNDCQPGTYSDTGFEPCLQCPPNTYANVRGTNCTSCPDHSHIPEGELQDSITRCVCDDGYTSEFATGGPCYPESSSSGSEGSSSTGSASQGESSSSGSEEPSSTGSESSGSEGSSSSGSSSSGSESSSTGSESSGSAGESSSTGSSGSESSSTGSEGSESSGSSSSGSSGTVDCGRGTYSSTGFEPCTPCPTNTYANIRETECTPCPANTHILEGSVADSLTRCVCDDGYESLWASGGPCYPAGTLPSYEYCDQGYYSEDGTAPCYPCPNNTYSNWGETECHSCPENLHILGGGVGNSITQCVCDDGYTSQWATGGPCYPIGSGEESSTAGQGEESSTGVSEPSDCSAYTTAYQCERDESCQAVYAHKCSYGRWKFVGCISADTYNNALKNGTCAINSETGERAWFPSRALPDSWSITPINKHCGSCCKADNQHHPGKNFTNVGTGCPFIDGGACALIEFKGMCPSMTLLNEWRINIIEAVATIVSARLNVSRAAATIRLTIAAVPRTSDGANICSVAVQILPPTVGSLTANDFMEAIWDQLTDSMSDDLPTTVAGVAGYRTYGTLATLVDDSIVDLNITTPSSSSSTGTTMSSSTGMSSTGDDVEEESSTSDFSSSSSTGSVNDVSGAMSNMNGSGIVVSVVLATVFSAIINFFNA